MWQLKYIIYPQVNGPKKSLKVEFGRKYINVYYFSRLVGVVVFDISVKYSTPDILSLTEFFEILVFLDIETIRGAEMLIWWWERPAGAHHTFHLNHFNIILKFKLFIVEVLITIISFHTFHLNHFNIVLKFKFFIAELFITIIFFQHSLEV